MGDSRLSYTSAEALPIKVLLNCELMETIVHDRIIPPVHAQFIPTNRCNLNCPMCSCSERSKKQEMTIAQAMVIIGQLAECGCKAVTLTGGGEPLCHPAINDILLKFQKQDIQVGLVTNGTMFDRLSTKAVQTLTWCRISNDDSRCFTREYAGHLEYALRKGPHVDWAFSHVAGVNYNHLEIKRVVAFANENNFTHVRIVADLFSPEHVNMKDVKLSITADGLDDSLVIYQGRKSYVRGGPCYNGYLKPLIAADCKVYACCGVQYALDPPSKDLPEELCLGSAFDLEKLMAQSGTIPLNGKQCVKCYYSEYNEVLAKMLTDVKHREFV